MKPDYSASGVNNLGEEKKKEIECMIADISSKMKNIEKEITKVEKNSKKGGILKKKKA